MKKEQVIEDLLELAKGMDKKQFQELTDEIFEESLKRLLENRKPEDVTPIREIIDKIFELCPSCTFVPLAYMYNKDMEIVTSKVFDGLVDLSNAYIGDINPKRNGDMTIVDEKEIYRLWEEASKLSNIQEGREKNVGDYSKKTHFDFIGYDKNTGKIITMYNVNR